MKLEPGANGTWHETLEVEVIGRNGKMVLYITFDKYSHRVNVQLAEGVETAALYDKDGKETVTR